MGAPADALSAALFGKTRRAVLALLYSHPDESHYLRQIARFVDSGQGAVQRELQRLTEVGILTRSVRGAPLFIRPTATAPSSRSFAASF